MRFFRPKNQVSSILMCCFTTGALTSLLSSSTFAFSNSISLPLNSLFSHRQCRASISNAAMTTTTPSFLVHTAQQQQQHRSATTRILSPTTSNRIRRFYMSSKNNDDSRNFFDGAPSTPGFKPGQFDKLTSWAMSTASNRPIVAEYEPDGLWLWTQWEGTIREMTTSNVLIAMFWALIVDLYVYQHYTIYILATAAVNGGDIDSLLRDVSWVSLEIPHSKDTLIETLTAMNSLWEYQLSLTIFTLSFFVNHAYSHWRMVYFCTRAIQGRINDLCMLVTLGAKRSTRYGQVDGITGYASNVRSSNTISNNDNDEDDTTTTTKDNNEGGVTNNNTGDAKKLVRDITRMLRMSHTLFWAATPTISDGFGDVHHTEGGIMGDSNMLPTNFDASQFGPMLLSKEGLEMLVRYGQLTQREMDALVATGLPPSQYPYVLLEWAGLRAMDGIEVGEIRGGQGMEENLLRQLNMLRAEYFNIGDYNAGRMPLAYVQTMEVLVDTLWFVAPLALYTKMGALNIVSTGLITLFFKGLLELSKSFLDPFGTEGYRAHNIRVDVLVSELNFGAAHRWVDAGDALPSEIFDENEPEQPPLQEFEQSTFDFLAEKSRAADDESIIGESTEINGFTSSGIIPEISNMTYDGNDNDKVNGLNANGSNVENQMINGSGFNGINLANPDSNSGDPSTTEADSGNNFDYLGWR